MPLLKFDSLPPPDDAKSSNERFKYCAQQGIFKHAIPTTFGGFGDQFQDLICSHSLLGSSCLDSGLILSINAHLWGAIFPLLDYGTEEQKNTWLAKLISGEFIAGHAITEPQAGSDLNALRLQVQTSEEGFVLNGCKRFITNSPLADCLVIYGCLDHKLSAFIVKNNDPGAEFTNKPRVSACSSAAMGDVILNNCRIPASRQLGKTGAGIMMIQHALELERAFIFAGITGIMEWQLNTVIRYSRERRVNEIHLGKYQALSHKIADMKLRLDSIRLWLRECAQLKDSNQRISLASAQTKLLAAEAFLQSSLDAVQILGSSGLIEGNKMLELVNDAMASRLFSGTSEIQKNIIAGLLGTGDGFRSK